MYLKEKSKVFCIKKEKKILGVDEKRFLLEKLGCRNFGIFCLE